MTIVYLMMGTCDSLKQNDLAFIVCKGDDSVENDPYCQQLQQYGYQSYQIPPLSFNFINLEKLASRLNQTGSYCGLVLTSARAVEACREACSIVETAKNILSSKLIFPVGPKTLETYRQTFNLNHPIDDEFINSVGSSEQLGSLIIDRYSDLIKKSGLSLLMPCSTISKEIIPTILNENEIKVDTFHCYETCPNPNLAQILSDLYAKINGKEVFLIAFSPSGVNSLKIAIEAANLTSQQFKFIAIGKTTLQALNDLNWPVFCVSEKPNPSSLSDSINKAINDIYRFN